MLDHPLLRLVQGGAAGFALLPSYAEIERCRSSRRERKSEIGGTRWVIKSKTKWEKKKKKKKEGRYTDIKKKMAGSSDLRFTALRDGVLCGVYS